MLLDPFLPTGAMDIDSVVELGQSNHTPLPQHSHRLYENDTQMDESGKKGRGEGTLMPPRMSSAARSRLLPPPRRVELPQDVQRGYFRLVCGNPPLSYPSGDKSPLAGSVSVA